MPAVTKDPPAPVVIDRNPDHRPSTSAIFCVQETATLIYQVRRLGVVIMRGEGDVAYLSILTSSEIGPAPEL